MIYSVNFPKSFNSEKNYKILFNHNNALNQYSISVNNNEQVFSNVPYTITDNVCLFTCNDIEPIIYIYNLSNTKLIYTNQKITYNYDTGKYEIYGYFPNTLINCNANIQESGWQTLVLDNCYLFN